MTVTDIFTRESQRGLIASILPGQVVTIQANAAVQLKYRPDGGDFQEVSSGYQAQSAGSVQVQGSGTPSNPITVTLTVQ